jgi:hypothetical protein
MQRILCHKKKKDCFVVVSPPSIAWTIHRAPCWVAKNRLAPPASCKHAAFGRTPASRVAGSISSHETSHVRGAPAPQTPSELQYNCRGLKMSSLWAWAQKPNTIYVICHIADLSSTDTNCTLLQPHNEISRPLLKLQL